MDPLRELELELMGSDVQNRIAKFQKLWRSKRVFTNTQGSWKTSPSALTAKIVTFKLPTNFRAVFDSEPKGFSEIMGYRAAFKKPVVRWDGRWIGDAEGVTKMIAKKGSQTIVFTEKYFDVLGLGNYEEALLTIVKNGWAPKILLRAKPTYKKIDGIFYVNKPFLLEDLRQELKKIPSAEVGSYNANVGGVPAITLKLKSPKWTYQFFKNGTVLFTGIKDPSERDAPRQLFKEFFTEKYDLVPFLAMNIGKSPALQKPIKGGNKEAKKAALANRYPLVSGWNARAPHGFYVRPGTNGKPRLYKWRKMERDPQSGETVNRGPMGLSKKNSVVVAKAYEKAGVNVPQQTLRIFQNLGIPIEVNKGASSVTVGLKNRRAPSWNSTKPGFYVRPGPGKQPYWFKIPEGLASGRKTVIKTYTDAGRNIPKAVRDIFKIPSNVKTSENEPLKHVVKMGLNRILRINNRQATRLTKAELLAIARNMNIPQANSKMNPAELISLIQSKSGVSNKLNRSYDAYINGIFYKLLNNGRVAKTTNQGVQTQRAWATLPVNEQNKIARELLPSNLHSNYNSITKANRFNALSAFMENKRPPKAKTPSPPKARTPSPSPNKNNNNFVMETEYALRLTENLGNLYKNGNELNFIKIYKGLPSGARGKPLKPTVTSAYKKFVKEIKGLRKNSPARGRYTSRISIPNWMPTSKVQAYKNLVTNLAFQKPKPKVANMKAAIRAWINREVPQSPPRAARDVENVVTGEIRHVPAYVPARRKTPLIPKRSPAAKKN